jgi:hypothetical protein
VYVKHYLIGSLFYYTLYIKSLRLARSIALKTSWVTMNNGNHRHLIKIPATLEKLLCPELPTKIILNASAGSKQDYAPC